MKKEEILYKNTDIEIRHRLKHLGQIDGCHWIEVRNYADSRVKVNLREQYDTVASCSFGKDSMTMVYKMADRGEKPLVVTCDTGYEIGAWYDYVIEQVPKFLAMGLEVVILDTNYFFVDRMLTRIEKEDAKLIGYTRGFPITLGMSFCTRDSKLAPQTHFVQSNVIGDQEHVRWAIGYAVDEARSVEDTDYFKYYYPLRELGLIERDCLEFIKKQDIYLPLYDFFTRQGCGGCPKQSLESLRMLWDKFPCEWDRWKKLEFWINQMPPIANPYFFTRFEGDKETVRMTTADCEEYFKSNGILPLFDDLPRSCFCGI
jgi:3'-phosphoadenosine 5'-phosphosulfate sulfotransferase (PAPS reductase)/FAD synthetase